MDNTTARSWMRHACATLLLVAAGCVAYQGDGLAPAADGSSGGATMPDASSGGAATPNDTGGQVAQSYVQPGVSAFVDTRRGTHNFLGASPPISYGNTFPATAVPFGFNFFTPVTNGDSAGWLYDYQKSTLQGFSVSHQPSTWMGDYGALQFWPMLGAPLSAPQARAVAFSHDDELARPYRYAVKLHNGIAVDIVPTDHAGVLTFTYPAATEAYLLLDAVQGARGQLYFDPNAQTVSGTVATNQGFAGSVASYVYGEFSGPHIATTGSPNDRDLALWLGFDTSSSTTLTVKFATSWLSVEQAKANLLAEVGAQSPNQLSDAAAARWDAGLSRLQITATDAQKVVFYGNFYRSLLYPNNRAEPWQGHNRYLSPYSGAVQQGNMWVNNGFWDTYRAQWPLLMLVQPTLAGQMVQGFANAYAEGGWTPRWSSPGYANLMTGTHSDSVFADAYVKGLTGFDPNLAYAAALHNATTSSLDAPGLGRNGLNRSMFIGYVPSDQVTESAAWHLEGCVNDAALAQMANALGRQDDAIFLRNRAMSYTNLFSPSVGFFRGKQASGAWRTSDANFNAVDWGNEFTEGDAWHYAFAAPFDARGMAALYGGASALGGKIDALLAASPNSVTSYYGGSIHEMFEAARCGMGQYGASNETVAHILYMYNYAGRPSSTQKWVRKVTDPASGIYTEGLGDGTGWLGDEDNGQMSAWFLFSALGFYPAVGATGEYLIGSPLYTSASVHLENGNTFVVSAPANGAGNIYVQSATLNGAAYSKNYITHRDILAGGTLTLAMGPRPSAWGSDMTQLPSSLSDEPDFALQYTDKAVGGTVTAPAPAASSPEVKESAFDDDSATKWLVTVPSASITYDFGAGISHPLDWYTLTSANDHPERDPFAWTLSGSTDGSIWVELDNRTGETFAARNQTRFFMVDQPQAYRYYRFTLANADGVSYLQVAEIELVSRK